MEPFQALASSRATAALATLIAEARAARVVRFTTRRGVRAMVRSGRAATAASSAVAAVVVTSAEEVRTRSCTHTDNGTLRTHTVTDTFTGDCHKHTAFYYEKKKRRK